MKFEMKKKEKVFVPFTISIDIETEDEFIELLLRMNVSFAAVRNEGEDSYRLPSSSGLNDPARAWGDHFQAVWYALDKYRDEHRLFGRSKTSL